MTPEDETPMLSAGTFSFFEALGANNDKTWFEAHRAEHRADVLEPMQALTAALGPERQPFKLLRLNRDVRFSSDKTPYKTMLGAAHRRPGGALSIVEVAMRCLCPTWPHSRRALLYEDTAPAMSPRRISSDPSQAYERPAFSMSPASS